MKPSDNIRIMAFAYSCHAGIYDEISLLHRVRYIDIRQDVLYTRHSHLNVPKAELIPLIVDYLFDEELAQKVIFVKNGYLSSPEIFKMADTNTDELKIFTKPYNSTESYNLHKSVNSINQQKFNDFTSINQTLPQVDSKSKWACSIKIRKNLIYTPLTIHKPNTAVTESVALLIPTKNESSDLEDCALLKYFIPSFLKTSKDSKIKVVFYIGYDTGDPIFHNAKNRERFRGLLSNYDVVFVELPRSGWLTFIGIIYSYGPILMEIHILFN